MVGNENSISVNGSAGHENSRVSGKRMSASSSQADRENDLLLEIRARDEQIAMMVEEHRNALAKMGKAGMHHRASSTWSGVFFISLLILFGQALGPHKCIDKHHR